MKNRSKKQRCILCGVTLARASVEGFWLHPEVDTCNVRIADVDGVSVDDNYVVEDGVIYELAPADAAPVDPPPAEAGVELPADLIMLDGSDTPSPFVSAEWALEEIFARYSVPRLGGASGDFGWSSFSTFQKCPYLWKRRYLDSKRGLLSQAPAAPALEIGTLVHVFLGVKYACQIDSAYPLTVETLHAELVQAAVTPDYLHEAWRVTRAYWAFYAIDTGWRPLAVEHHVVDPKTKHSCRIDVIMHRDESAPGLPAGTYLWDHKTASRFDYATLNGWKNDGEIIGLWDLYERTKMRRRFGELQGICVNIIGKQKVPNFHRTWVFPSRALVRDHRTSLRVWSAAIETAQALGSFPRARAACVTKFGQLCDEFDGCSQDEPDLEARP